MLRFSRTWLAFASTAALGVVSASAHAQVTAPTSTSTTTTPTGVATPCVATPGGQPIVSVTQQIVPNRIVAGQPTVTSTRPPALNPNGINFSDCAEDMTLQFLLTACNFTGQNLQVFASRSGSDCTSQSDRGLSGVAVCWPVSTGSTGLVLSQGTQTINIRVQDIVGPENESPSPTNMQSFGSSACNAQSSFLAVPININFLPLDPGTGALVGTNYIYPLGTDLVGPPAPAGVGILNGDTLFTVNWTPNVDTDTGGYDVLLDPIRGQEPPDAMVTQTTTGGGTATTVLVCPAEAGGTEDSSTDGAITDATVMTPASPPIPLDGALGDSGCHFTQIASTTTTATSNGGTCNDPVLSGATLADAGSSTPVAPVEEIDDAGNVIDTGVAVVEGVGGIFVPPNGIVVDPNPGTGTTATGATNSTFTVTGLKNGFNYNVAVSAVDNYGNIGPPSTQQCAVPAPVDDFWKTYRLAGGEAGGGFCALEAVGAPAGTTAAFVGAGALFAMGLRRRRSRRR